MRYLKILGLAAVMAAAFTACVGAGTASATVLCKTALTSGCAASGWDMKTGDVLEASVVGTMTFTSTNTATTYKTCSGGAWKLTVESTGGASETVKLDASSNSDISWSGCSHTTDTLSAGTMEIHHIAGTDNGTVTSKGLEFTTTIFGSCVYGTGTGTDLGILEGGATPKVTIHGVIKRQGGSCLGPAEMEWNATYHVTNPTPLYVGAS